MDQSPPNSKKVMIYSASGVRRARAQHHDGHAANYEGHVSTGVMFAEVDDYSDPLLAHNILANAWAGTTEIHETQLDEQETQHIIEPSNPAGE